MAASRRCAVYLRTATALIMDSLVSGSRPPERFGARCKSEERSREFLKTLHFLSCSG